MIVKQHTVKTEVNGRETAWTIEVEVPETLAEAVEMFGEERVLANMVRQHIQDEANRSRAEKHAKPSARKLYDARVAELVAAIGAGDTSAIATLQSVTKAGPSAFATK